MSDLKKQSESEASQPTMSELVEVFRQLVDEASRAQYQVAVKKKDAARMLGMKDESFIDNLTKQRLIRTRKAPGSNTILVSVQSLRQYMGDLPRKTSR